MSDEKQIDLTLNVDGQDIPIGHFVEEIVSGGILGMINTLKGVEDPEKIEITIEITGPQSRRFRLVGHGERYTQVVERLGRLEQSVDYDAPLPFFVYVDKGDEVIDWRASAARHEGIARFRSFEGGSHLFEHVREALDDFAAARNVLGQ